MDRRLAAPLTAGIGPLLGRERDLVHLKGLLGNGVRLITLRGPGGIGKTALALHLAHAVRDTYDQVEFVDLTSLRDPAGVLGVIAGALPTPPRNSEGLRRIRDFAAQGTTLLVLDNFEQLLPAAGQLGELIATAETLQVVVTSRSALHLHDEHEYPVGPLALPQRARHAAASPAVQLFVTRVQASLPSFELSAGNRADVMRLCEVLEGVPLALELAAARLRTYALPELLARLEHPLGILRADFRDRPERLRSLRAAVQWSYDLLDEGDRAVFECCAVFEGGFTPDALVDVWGGEDVLDRIEALIEQSFLQRLDTPDTRWRMLQPLRELAAGYLEGRPLAPLWRERHALHFLKMIEDRYRRWFQTTTDDRGAYLAHYPNIRAGLVWAVEQRRADLAYRYLGTIGTLWMPFGLLAREAPLAEQVLALPAPADREVRVRALQVGASCLGNAGQFPAQATRLHEILALCRDPEAPESAAWARLNLSWVEREAGRSAEAWQLLQEVLREYAARLGDRTPDRMQRMLHASALLHAALSLLDLGQCDLALDHAAQAHGRYRDAGNSVFELESGAVMGLLMVHLRRLPEARLRLLAGLHESVDRGFRGVAEDTLRWGFTALAAEGQEWKVLVQLVAFVNDPALERAQSAPDRRVRQHLALARAALGEADFREAWEAGTRLLLPDAVELAERLAQEPGPPQARAASELTLTPREWEVLALVSQGHPDRRIAGRLGISPGTASKHVGNLLGKLGLQNRVELTRWAIEQGRADQS
ncbi:LuxR C-terminal-related transcriptional regulator [Deinococcus sp. YIM 134068]|uniref:helix-turn-helix transcriptional regulator n=1 Tax=Deinococcus lichenicola TaxID=3118910 RepID=UPI002F937147